MTTRCAVLVLSTPLLLLSGCAGSRPAPVVTSGADEVLLPTVARSFAQLNAGLHPELRNPPRHGVTVETLRSTRDTHLYTEERVRWGQDEQLPVLLFSDTDRPSRSDGAMTAWFLGPDPGDGAPEVVGAVLYRDFDDAPRADDPYQLMGSLAESFPAPWVFCTPSSRERMELLFAYDSARGIKVAMFHDGTQPASWSVDHVEFVSTLLAIEDWWRAKGYGDCLEEDVLQ